MTRIIIKKLVWDAYNIEHIKKHNVTEEEIRAVAENIIVHEKAKKGRYAVFGRAGRRILTIIIRKKKQTEYYLVTARDSAKRERKKVHEKERYKKEKI